MKIVISTPKYPPLKLGGVPTICQLLAERLTEKGHEVVVNLKGDGEDYTLNGVRVKVFSERSFLLGYQMNPLEIKSIAEEDPDVIHSYHYGYFPATAGFLASKIKRVPHVFTLEYHPPIYGWKRAVKFWLYHISQGLPILRGSSRVTPLTNYEKDLLLEVGADESNMEIVPNPVNADFYRKKETDFLSEFGDTKEKIVLHPAGSSRVKGIGQSFRIGKRVLEERDDCTFAFVITREDDPMKKKISEEEDMITVPWLNEEGLVKAYSNASVIIHPSYYDAFGMVLAESMACETPPVSTTQGGIPEVVLDGETGLLVDYGQWGEMKEKINYLLDDDGVRRTMGKNGRKHVVENFDYKKVVDKFESIYENCVSSQTF